MGRVEEGVIRLDAEPGDALAGPRESYKGFSNQATSQ